MFSVLNYALENRLDVICLLFPSGSTLEQSGNYVIAGGIHATVAHEHLFMKTTSCKYLKCPEACYLMCSLKETCWAEYLIST